MCECLAGKWEDPHRLSEVHSWPADAGYQRQGSSALFEEDSQDGSVVTE